jgi:hypothetical protein
MIFIMTKNMSTVLCKGKERTEEKKIMLRPPLVGIEPTIFGLEVQRVNPLRHRGYVNIKLIHHFHLHFQLYFLHTVYNHSLNLLFDFPLLSIL